MVADVAARYHRAPVLAMLATILLLLAGCAKAPSEPGPEPVPGESEVPDVGENQTEPTPMPETTTWVGNDCQEIHGHFLFDESEYEGQMPPGFKLALEDGQAVIQTYTLTCTEGHIHLVAVLVEPPEERAWLGATHGLLMEEAWVAIDALPVLRDAGIPAIERGVEITKLGVLSGVGAVIRSDPDFVMNIHANPTEEGAMDEQVRFFGAYWNAETSSVEVTPDRALDMIRSPSLSWTGPASAHSLPVVGGGMLPFDVVGTGASSFETLPVNFAAVYA